MQRKATRVAAASASVGLNIYKGKSKIIKYNTENTKLTTLDEEAVEQVESFTYLGSITDERGGSDVDIKARIGKAKDAEEEEEEEEEEGEEEGEEENN
ncbi:unnamed protein product [Schistosoma mattheei]|uniref:Uncharacterized protein n=1 Tax=Schistosoma mattheei TaxID=31246 RepID=A0A183PB60_9TREM|nr:unnamed protein product [Schistosoma mattheei]